MLAGAVVAALALAGAAVAVPPASNVILPRGPTNATQLAICQQIQKAFTGQNSAVYYAAQLEYTQYIQHWSSASTQIPACVAAPATNADVAVVVKACAASRTPFAIESGGHGTNPGWSSTTGIHMTMQKFQQVAVSADRSYVDVGPGQVWDNVYAAMDPQGLTAVGGRVAGVGVGGYLTGGGGYSWLSNQYGLSIDTVLSFTAVLADGSVVTATGDNQFQDLFFAIKGAGNRIAVTTNIRFKTFPIKNVYGGLRVYTMPQLDAVNAATSAFQANNNDPKAQVITTYEAIPLLGGNVLLLTFYDLQSNTKLPSPSPFAPFDAIPTILNTEKVSSYNQFVAGIPSNLSAGGRALFQTVSLRNIDTRILKTITDQIAQVSIPAQANSGTLLSWDVEPFLLKPDNNIYTKSQGGAFPHSGSEPWTPLNLYFGWASPTADSYFSNLILKSAQQIADAANAQGQNINSLPLYPNYAHFSTTGDKLFRGNLDTLKQIRAKYDPNYVFTDLLTGFGWPRGN